METTNTIWRALSRLPLSLLLLTLAFCSATSMLADTNQYSLADYNPTQTVYFTDANGASMYLSYDQQHKMATLSRYQDNSDSPILRFPSVVTYGGVDYVIVAVAATEMDDRKMEVQLPEHLLRLGQYAFGNLSNVFSVTLPQSVEELDYYVTGSEHVIDIHVTGNKPITFTNTLDMAIPSIKNTSLWLHVPDNQLADYHARVGNNIHVVSEQSPMVLNLHNKRKGQLIAEVQAACGNQLWKVNELHVTGGVSQDDWLSLGKILPNLHTVDMGKAELQGTINTSTLRETSIGNLRHIVLPQGSEDITVNGPYLQSIVIPEGTKRVLYCGAESPVLTNVSMPESVEEIGDNCFYQCSSLRIEKLPASLRRIGKEAFYKTKLPEHFTVPEGVEEIGDGAFFYCHLRSLSLPSTLRKAEDVTDYEVLTDLYLHSLTPIFCSIYYPLIGGYPSSVTAHVPAKGLNNWKGSAALNGIGSIVGDLDELPTIVRIGTTANLQFDQHDVQTYHPDIVMDSEPYSYYTGIPGGRLQLSTNGMFSARSFSMHINPSVVGEEGAGRFDMLQSNSLLLEGNMRSDTTLVTLHTNSSLQYITMPFNVRVGDIIKSHPNSFYTVMAYHPEQQLDDRNRYQLTWQTLGNDDIMQAGRGYVFYGNFHNDEHDTFTLPAHYDMQRQGLFVSDDVSVNLAANPGEVSQHINWNFVGNPYPCYYDKSWMSLDAPITVWNPSYGRYDTYSQYEDYLLSPGEPFFIQRPTVGNDKLTFSKEGRQLERPNPYAYAKEQRVGEGTRMHMPQHSNEKVEVYKLSIEASNEALGKDHTLVVLNADATRHYEPGRDAVKFASDTRTVQIYTLYNICAYAVNERPDCDEPICLALSIPATDDYTLRLSAPQHAWLYDKLTGDVTELNDGSSLTLRLEAGTYVDRFYLQCGTNMPTGIETLASETHDNAAPMRYKVNGQKAEEGYRGITIDTKKHKLTVTK